MNLYTLLKDVEITKTNLSDFGGRVCALTDRSDKIKAGGVFVCVSGIRFDGHDYIPEARLKGAALIVAQRLTADLVSSGMAYVITPDTRAALALMWSAWYSHPERALELYAVTGTNGKSSTCVLLRSVLSAAGKSVGLIGSIKNEFGALALPDNPMTTPDSETLFGILAKMRDAGADSAVVEASSHALALSRLYGLRFKVGVFTGLSPEHLDFHPTMVHYAQAKAKLFTVCDTALANADDPYFHDVCGGATCPVRTFSVKGRADFSARDIEYLPGGGIEYQLYTRKEMVRIESPLCGRFSVYNTLAAAGCAAISGIPAHIIARGISNVCLIPGRMERLENDAGLDIFIDYAHTPHALEAVLTEVRRYARGRVITVFGCGGDRDKAKRPFMGRVANELSDLTVITTDNPRNEDPDAIIADILRGVEGGTFTVVRDRAQAIAHALSLARRGDTLLIAGKGHEDYQIDAAGTHPFNERQIVRECLEKRKE